MLLTLNLARQVFADAGSVKLLLCPKYNTHQIENFHGGHVWDVDVYIDQRFASLPTFLKIEIRTLAIEWRA